MIPRGGMTMPCDSVLLTGNAIVNEATLTGQISILHSLIQRNLSIVDTIGTG